MKAIDILSTKEVSEIYKEKLSLAINKDFFLALGTFNPPLQKLARGYRLFLENGDQVDVPDSFEVEVYETSGFRGEL
jgi:hypothetical protein